MLSKDRFQELVEQQRVAQVRVVPVPFDRTWCIDVVVRTPLEPGSKTGTLAEPNRPSRSDRLRTYETIDGAARFLQSIGVTTFTVDSADAPSAVNVGTNAVRILETTQRLWQDDDVSATARAV